MDKRIQDVQKFIMDKKNRTTVIAGIAGFVIAVAGAAMATKRGKKRK